MRSRTRSGADVTVRRGLPSEDMDDDIDAEVDLTNADADADAEVATAAPATTGKAKRARRNRITRNACRQCRQKKSKCDGQHPTCARCRQSDMCCTYDVSEGVTKMQSLKDQLEDKSKEHERLSALLRVLVEANDHQATTLLARLRLAHASGQELTTNPPDYLGPTLHSSQSFASLFANPSTSTAASHPYSHASSIAAQSSLDTDQTRFVSSPEDPNATFTHWDAQHTHEDYDTASSHTTGSPGSAGYDASSSTAVQHHELSSPNATGNGGFDLDLGRRMSSTMAGWPYDYVTGAAGGPEYYPPMGAAGSGAEVHDWAGAGSGEPRHGVGGGGYGMLQQQQPSWSGQ